MANDSSSGTPDLWSSLEPLKSVRVYQKGELLFQQGQQADGIYMIQTGQVQVWMPDGVGEAAVVVPIGAGTMLGLSETISEGTHKLSAEALVQTEVWFLARVALLEFLKSHQDVCMQVVRALSEDLHGLYHKFQSLKAVNPRVRRWVGS